MICIGLSAPVPRGRKGKKAKEKGNKLQSALEEDMAKANVEDPEILLTDTGYKKHLQRHANKWVLQSVINSSRWLFTF